MSDNVPLAADPSPPSTVFVSGIVRVRGGARKGAGRRSKTSSAGSLAKVAI